jgi:uncharacterized repeat protein (TIGR01451 family)
VKNLLLKFSATLCFLGFLSEATAQLIVPFTQRTSPSNPGVTIYNLNGDFTMIGNTNLTLQSYGDNTSNNNPMVFVDIDNEASTLNSSSAQLSLSGLNGGGNNCSEVVYAGLYWTGRAHNGTTSPNEFSVTKNGVTTLMNKQLVKLKGPNASSYSTITATSTDIYYPQNSEGFMYSSYAEVTQYVQNNGVEGIYTVADIALNEGNGGSTGFYGGWGLVVIYANNELPLKDITVFDGHAYVAGNVTADFTIPLSGFNSTQSGPVNVKMGMITGEGDRNISGDFFQIRNAANTAWVNLNHGGNSANNFFNSSIFTGGNARNPNLLNNTGLDISMFNLPNTNNSIIANNQTATTFRYGTTQDTYIIFSIIFAVDAYQPDIVGVNSLETVNGSPSSSSPTVLPGENLSYNLDVFNLGNEPITNGQIIIPIPYNTNYVSSSGNYLFSPNSNATPFYDPALGSNGSIVWNIGDLPLPATPTTVLAQLSYTLSATEDCLILSNLSCDNVIEVNGTITGVGTITGTSLFKNFISGYEENSSCSGFPITEPLAIPIIAEQFVKENCSDIQTSYSFIFCGLQNSAVIQTNQISGSFPVGTRFFDSSPVTTASIEYTNSGFPVVSGSSTYYAFPQGTDAPCALELTITVIDSVLTSVPEVVDYTYCVNEAAVPISATPSNGTNSVYYYSQFPGGSPSGQIIPSTAVAGNFVYYAVEAISNNCISSSASPINVNVYAPGTASLSGINGTNEFTATVTAGDEICFDVFILNSQPAQPVVVSYSNSIAGASFTNNGEQGSGTFCWTPDSNQEGTFTVVLSLTDNCGITQTFNYEIIVENTPCDVSVTVENIQGIICSENDGSAMITASGGVAPYTFTLLNNTTGEVFSGNTGVFTDLTPGSYSVFVVDANNCQPVCTNLNFEVSGSFEPIVAEVNASNDPCSNAAGGSLVINASGGTPDYLYSIGGQFQALNTFTGLTSGTYSVNIIDANGCSYSTTASINGSAPVSVSVSGILPDFCGLNNGGFTVNISGGQAPFSVLVNGQPVNVGPITGLGAGSYTISVTDANNCSASSSAIITSPSPLQTSIGDVVQPNCVVSNGSFNIVVSGGTSPYQFNMNGVQNNNGSFTNLSPGNYTVNTTDANGCTSSSSVEVTAPIDLIAELSNVSEPTCGTANGSFSVSVSQGTAPYTYNLNGVGMDAGDFNNLTAGTYTVVVSDANLCSQNFTVTLTGTPAYSISGTQTNVACNGACDGSLTVSGTTANLSYSWSNGSTGSQLTGLCAGTYIVNAVDQNGCEQSATFTIEEPSALTLNLVSVTNANCNTNDGSAVINAVGGTAPYTYSIAGSSQPNLISNNTGSFGQLSPGSYAYFVTDANGCTIECVQLFFISNDCASGASPISGMATPTSNQLLVTKSNDVYKVNYAISEDSPMQLVFLNAQGEMVQEIQLINKTGKFDIVNNSNDKQFVFAVLRDANGTIHATTRVR